MGQGNATWPLAHRTLCADGVLLISKLMPGTSCSKPAFATRTQTGVCVPSCDNMCRWMHLSLQSRALSLRRRQLESRSQRTSQRQQLTHVHVCCSWMPHQRQVSAGYVKQASRVASGDLSILHGAADASRDMCVTIADDSSLRKHVRMFLLNCRHKQGACRC